MKDYKGINKIEGTIPDDFFTCYFEFYGCLKSGDREQVMHNLDEMKKYVISAFAPDVFRLVYINLVHCFSGSLGDEYVQQHLENMPDTVEDAFGIIADMTDKYFEQIYISGNSSEYLKREVLKIVDREFSNPLLSVSMLADRLGISTSYLSRYFKDKTGVTLFSYIDEIRISKAKQLLAETDAPVKDIVKAVGYNDINNFNRKFKSKTGKTPSSYRKK
ncbi:MAG: helix-turn-helix transcriptional regulator [Clostridia bacterium]|nr:helix-turn-helix transcriptional regulator [Clostridia bacterium]